MCTSNPPRVQQARKKACDVLKQLGMIEPPFDPRRIAESLGVEIIYSQFPNRDRKEVSGYIRKNGNQIVVNADENPKRQFFTIAHELGHKILHPAYVVSPDYEVLKRNNSYSDGKPAREIEADIFASHLMIPFSALKRYVKIATVEELAKLFMVSESSLRNQLYWLGTTGNG